MDALYLELLEQHPNSGINLTVVHPFTVNTGWYYMYTQCEQSTNLHRKTLMNK